ncbi:nitrogen regulation protein NR(II) [Vreelandella utahensis]|uniref:nitrogen regulation protein NR(II) n=1 Tax=Vreelandella halophila TaxID=86177 RepID=UPI00098598FE|nr:nitrogen regulation protein NR(II) [Halomonas utahensis]
MTEPMHQRILDNLATAVLVLDHDKRTRYLNPAAEMLLQTSGDRIRGQPVTSIFVEPDAALQTLTETAATGHTFTKREAELLLPSGQLICVDYSISPFPGDDPLLLMEIQQRDRLQRISREEELLTQQETTRTLVRGMAHEIKNPLGGIRGAAQLLERELENADLRDFTRVIMEEADRLRSLVDRMLGPNRAIETAPTNIHDVVEHVRTLLEAEGGSQVSLVRDYDPSIPEFMGDREQLIQAILNIARNALEVLTKSPPEDAEPRITMRTRALRQFTIGHTRHRLVCRVDIIDNGPGIPRELQPNIFYPMISGRPDGTGLGLAITQSIVGQHQGLVECESRPGCTRFIIFLPLEASE